MHICSTLGYFSVCRREGGVIRIRSTSHSDLFALLGAAGLEQTEIIAASDTHQGYPYYVAVSENELASVMMTLADTVTYPAFSAAIAQIDSQRTRVPLYQAFARSMGVCVAPPETA